MASIKPSLGTTVLRAVAKTIRIHSKKRLADLLFTEQDPIEQTRKISNLTSIKKNRTRLSKTLYSVSYSNDEKTKISKAEKAANLEIALSLVSLGCANGAILFPPLLVGTMIGLICLAIFRCRTAYQELVIERRITVNLLDAITQTGFFTFGFYFIGSYSILFSSISRKLLAQTKDNSQRSLINIFGEQPLSVWLLTDGVEIETPLEMLQRNDIIVVYAGQTIPVDGTIVFGSASIDQHRLTGEAQPAEKGVDETVFAATVVLSGKIHVVVKETGQETQVAQIGNMLNQTADFKLAIQSRGEELADKSVIPTIAAGGLGWLLLGASGAMAIVYCPIGWFIRLSSPLSLLNYLRILSQNQVLVKDARSLEILTKVDTVIFDKTGTLTLEQPHISAIYTCHDLSEDRLLQYAATAELKQTHPIAKAILAEAQARDLKRYSVDKVHYEVGYGIKVESRGERIWVGSSRFMAIEGVEIPSFIENIYRHCSEQGHNLVMVAIEHQLVGAIELHTTVRSEVRAVVNALRQRNKTIYIISGDHEQSTRQLAAELEIEHYFANALPSQKADLIDQLQAQGKSVCFVGDGINDSIALRKATVSISLAGATTVATDIAQIIFTDSSLERLPMLFDIAEEMKTNMNHNFALSVAPGVLCIGGAFLLHFGMMAATIIFFSGLFLGVGNSMLPLIRHKTS